MTEQTKAEPLEYARKAVELADERQATDIVLLDLRGIATFADFFVILTTETRRQLGAVAADLDQELRKVGVPLHHREGSVEGGWMLLDFGNVIVHLFGTEERAYYQLDQVWAHAPALVRIQ